MWIFADFGLLMPSTIPTSVLERADTPAIVEAVERGWTLQVRGRIAEHVQHFMDTYMEPGTFSVLYKTPDMDYNVRFYTTHEEFNKGLSKAVLEIDYTKFKPTAERYAWGRPYHNVLNSIWSVLLDLAPAGGTWGKKSIENPRGFDKISPYADDPLWWDTYDFPAQKATGGILENHYGISDWGGEDQEVEEILDSVVGIPATEWQDYLPEYDFNFLYSRGIVDAQIAADRSLAEEESKNYKRGYKKAMKRLNKKKKVRFF